MSTSITVMQRTTPNTCCVWRIRKKVDVIELTPNMTVISELWFIYFQTNNHGFNKLHITVCRGSAYENIACQIVKTAPYSWLLDTKIERQLTALHLAVYRKLSKVIRTLLLQGADPLIEDKSGNTALAVACSVGTIESFGPFMDMFMDDQQGSFPKQNIRLSRTRILLCLEKKNRAGETCLHIAVATGNCILAKILLKYGANPNAQTTKFGYTPLHIAVDKGNEIMVDLLLAYGSDVNACSYYKISVLEMASSSDEEMIMKLVAAGAMPELGPFKFDTIYGGESRDNRNI